MKVWIDVAHMPQYNFYKPLILLLIKNGHQVYITILDRGRLVKIMHHELSNIQGLHMYVIGKHRMKKISAIIDANIMRMLRLLFWVPNKQIDIAISNNLFTPILGWLFRIPNYAFGDDPQVIDYKPKIWFSNQSHYCIFEQPENMVLSPKIKVLRCTKEWAYLNSRTFKPDFRALEAYGMKQKEYMFLREVSVGTINYTGQESGAILGIKDMIPKGMKVLFSLEEKKRRGEYPEDWILLQEPIEDIHSLIYYSAGLVSSGDSMAREAALMGVPAYYLGIRYSMPANAAANKVAGLQNRQTMPFEEWIQTLSTDIVQAERKQQELRKHIDEEFIDINQYMLDLVESVEQNKKSK